MSRQETGKQGEAVAVAFLQGQGYRILHRNYRCGRLGELDVVAEEAGTLVFIEVKTRRSERFGTGAEAVDRRKQARLYRLAEWYVADQALANRTCRFDVVEVTPGAGGWECRLIRNAFWG